MQNAGKIKKEKKRKKNTERSKHCAPGIEPLPLDRGPHAVPTAPTASA